MIDEAKRLKVNLLELLTDLEMQRNFVAAKAITRKATQRAFRSAARRISELK